MKKWRNWKYKQRNKVDITARYWWCYAREQRALAEVCQNRVANGVCLKYKRCDYFNQWREFMGDQFEIALNKLIKEVEVNTKEPEPEKLPCMKTHKEKVVEKKKVIEEKYPSKHRKSLSTYVREHPDIDISQLVMMIRMAISKGTVESPNDLRTARLKKTIRYYRYRDRKNVKKTKEPSIQKTEVPSGEASLDKPLSGDSSE